MDNKKHTYILIHGAWHASWCWETIASQLKEAGHTVVTPDLPGHGTNEQDFTEINLSTYVKYIVSLINAQEQRVILVGHSMAGIIISQTAEYIPEKIKKLIYLVAFIPKNKQSLSDTARQSETLGISTEMQIDDNKNEIKLNLSKRTKELFFNYCSPNQADRALYLLQPEPLKPFIEPLKLTQQHFGKVDKVYIECVRDLTITLPDQKRMYKNIVKNVITLNADHSPFLSDSNNLVKALLAL